MDLSLLATLKEKLVHAKDFSDVMTYFLDHFGENPEFRALGERGSDPFLEVIFAQVGLQLFNREIQVHNPTLLRLVEHHFIHGMVVIEDRLTSVLYFQDIRMGLLAVLWSLNPTETKYARFRGHPTLDRWTPSAN